MDYQADYRASQSAGHHRDCDGWRMHSVGVKRIEAGTHVPECPLGCDLLVVGSSSSPAGARSMVNHGYNEPCDGRCRDWN